MGVGCCCFWCVQSSAGERLVLWAITDLSAGFVTQSIQSYGIPVVISQTQTDRCKKKEVATKFTVYCVHVLSALCISDVALQPMEASTLQDISKRQVHLKGQILGDYNAGF